MRPWRRWLPWLAVVAVVAGALVIGAGGDGGPPTPGQRASDLAASLRCPTCRGQSVRDSDAPAAEAIRTEIARRIDEGQGDEEIRAFLVTRYGPAVLLTPPRSGLAALVWALPVAALVGAVAGLALAFRRWRSVPGGEVSDDDRALVAWARRSRAGGGGW
ncbi:MAG: cytochrome c-type biogenesis protein [Acidimicrobiales bacterium]